MRQVKWRAEMAPAAPAGARRRSRPAHLARLPSPLRHSNQAQFLSGRFQTLEWVPPCGGPSGFSSAWRSKPSSTQPGRAAKRTPSGSDAAWGWSRTVREMQPRAGTQPASSARRARTRAQRTPRQVGALPTPCAQQQRYTVSQLGQSLLDLRDGGFLIYCVVIDLLYQDLGPVFTSGASSGEP